MVDLNTELLTVH